MKNIVFVIALSTAACAQTATSQDTQTDHAMLQPSQYGQMVGRWQFVYTDERRAAVEAKLASSIADPAELAKAKKEASEEAAVSQIEFTADRVYVSRIGDKEILRAGIDRTPKDVGVSLRDPNTLVMHDPQKGDLVFSRVK